MKLKVKIAIIGLLVVLAALLSAFAVVENTQTEEDGATVSCMTEEETSCFVLRNYKGYVAVFKLNDPTCPMTVTDIQVSTLRELDRTLLETGIKLYSQERLMMTLEDLGS